MQSADKARIPGQVDAAGEGRRTLPREGTPMIVLGIILLLIGFIAKIAILWTIGIIALVVGLILLLLGSMGRAVGGRRHYW
jgi:uncharacterized membrane protein HdeD (DUF308 family)